MTHRRPLPAALVLASILSLTGSSCSGDGHEVLLASAGTSASSDTFGVTGGGFRVESCEPTLFYGSVVENGQRSYTYLVIGKNMSPSGSDVEQRNWGTAEVDGQQLKAEHTLRIQTAQLAASYAAAIGPNELTDKTLELNGEATAEDDWLFVYDASRSDAAPKPVPHVMPELPPAFEALEAFTLEFVAGLPETNEVVREFLDR